jgi:hypothetical protein
MAPRVTPERPTKSPNPTQAVSACRPQRTLIPVKGAMNRGGGLDAGSVREKRKAAQ